VDKAIAHNGSARIHAQNDAVCSQNKGTFAKSTAALTRTITLLSSYFNKLPVRIGISAACLIGLYLQIQPLNGWVLPHGYILTVALMFALLNVGLEMCKWHISACRFGARGAVINAKATLAGIALSMITPNRTGDYLGRMTFYDKSKWMRTVIASLPGNMIQLLTTISGGLFALMYFDAWHWLQIPSHPLWATISVILIIVSGIFIYIVFVNRRKPLRYVAMMRLMRPFISLKFSLQLGGLSLLRYLTFCIQFAVVLHLLGGGNTFMISLFGIMAVYLIKSFLPLVAFGELGVREGIVWGVFTILGVDAHIAVTASLITWTFNLLLPALAGVVVLVLHPRPKLGKIWLSQP
jgi:hypothetical protein